MLDFAWEIIHYFLKREINNLSPQSIAYSALKSLTVRLETKLVLSWNMYVLFKL